ncbi:hypothetical protein [Nannocystis pusilla]|uniref:hypothetical protein n=1 Tax=Nannocystis pusilla TaxID=889268 RepID=UPI003B7F21D0
MSCFRGYVRADPAAFVLARDRPGAAIGGSIGVFRARGAFAVAFGGRVGYDMVDRRASGFDRTLHLSPELRLGAVNQHAFGYVLVRGGYSHRFEIPRPRPSSAGRRTRITTGSGSGSGAAWASACSWEPRARSTWCSSRARASPRRCSCR